MSSFAYKFDELMNPLITALKLLGGSGTNGEINEKVAEIVNIPSQDLDILHNPDKGGMTEFEYRLMWTRTYLKNYGIVDNSARGIWVLTEKGMKNDRVDEKEVVRAVREMVKNSSKTTNQPTPLDTQKWQNELLQIILSMKPDAFERLVQRILRESGFIQVEVTGRSGDGGVDGQGILKLGGLLSFHVIFQAKRWKGSVGPNNVRDFRGAMVGRADKGLLITTGTFTKDAIKESTRDGAPAIDLIDGDQLAEKLKQLNLGVVTEKVEIEKVKLIKEWFQNI